MPGDLRRPLQRVISQCCCEQAPFTGEAKVILAPHPRRAINIEKEPIAFTVKNHNPALEMQLLDVRQVAPMGWQVAGED